MSLAPTPCLEAGCRDHVVKNGRCQAHQKPWQNSHRRNTLPPDWSTRRLIVLKRGQGVCYLCGQAGADTVDHIIPGDDHDLSNLAPVHDRVAPHCHRYKSSREGHEAKQSNTPRPRA